MAEVPHKQVHLARLVICSDNAVFGNKLLLKIIFQYMHISAYFFRRRTVTNGGRTCAPTPLYDN